MPHRDPFDRLLAAQAELSGLTLASLDPALQADPCRLLWYRRQSRSQAGPRTVRPQGWADPSGDRLEGTNTFQREAERL
ncbi:hypothetical protein [Synechococcus sp. CCY9202]|uniref:hypothetical protein n=1 Tax=Synechococcus sp. CCY9202 TaxID=174698 RepID=UPI002B200F09|nr:hypothetical protein [Synechococcus sp. CCY9202]MEA5422632.1 hypothetical protein [Synechococcus sp. CCY9202]